MAVITRLPEVGRVKMRLAVDMGDVAAQRIYCRLLLDTLRRVSSLEQITPIVALAADGPTVPLDSQSDGLAALTAALRDCEADPAGALDGGTWRLRAQRGEGLGARLANVFQDLFSTGHTAAALVNGDSPVLPTEYLRRALRQLNEAVEAGRRDEVVLGPATDGGFYLIGVHRETWVSTGEVVAGALAATPMSTAGTAAALADSLGASGLHVRRLPLWLDVDRPADLPAYQRLLAGEHDAADVADLTLPDDAPHDAERRGGHAEAPGDGAARVLRGEPLVGLREIYLHITNRCGLGCPHCYNRTNPRDPDELTTAEWRDAIDQCVDLGASSFVFLGGDPLLRDDLFDLIDHVSRVHGRMARIFFNGACDEDMARRFAAAGHGRLRPLLSVDGDRDVNDELRGPGNFANTLAAIHNLTAAGLAPVVNTVTLAPVLPTLSDMARAVKAAGATRLHLILPHQRGGLPTHLELLPSGKAMLAAIKELAATCEQIDLVLDNLPSWRRRLGARQDFCTAGCRDLAIDPFGNVHACTVTCGDPTFVAGDLRRDRLDRIWRYSPALRLLRAGRTRDRAECAACPVVDACGGECWMQAHYAARVRGQPAGLLAPFPYCDLVRPLLEEMLAGGGAGGVAGTVCGDGTEPCASAGGHTTTGGEADYTLFDCI